MKAEILFEPRDLWIGVYWTRVAAKYAPEKLVPGAGRVRFVFFTTAQLWIYICLIPCLPILLKFPRSR